MADRSRLPGSVWAISRRFRRRRMQRFCDAFGVERETLDLDVGGTGQIWDAAPTRPRLVLVNLAPITPVTGVRLVRADARRLPFGDARSSSPTP